MKIGMTVWQDGKFQIAYAIGLIWVGYTLIAQKPTKKEDKGKEENEKEEKQE